MARFSVPTTARLPSSLRVDATNPAVVKSLNRLSREALISLALDWLDDENLPNAVPYIERRHEDDEANDDLYPPCQSIDDLQQLYIDMQQQKGSKRDVVSRIVEGDWRIGLTLYQLAMADMAYFDQNPTSQKWSAYSILPLKQPSQYSGEDQVLKVDKENLKVPRFHPSTFLQNLQTHVLPDVKAHYHFHRPKDIPVLVLRIFVVDSPYNTGFALSGRDAGGVTNFDSSRTVYIAFPDGSPSLYITKSQATGSAGSGEFKSLQSLIVDGVPKALSRPRERYTLKSGNLSSKNLDALLEKKGSGRMNAAGGGWSIYTNESTKVSPLDTVLPSPPLSRESSLTSLKRGAPLTERQQASKKARLAAKARFGDTGIVTDGKGVEKVDIVIQDPFPTNVDLGEADESGDKDDTTENGRKNRRKSKIDAVIREANDATEEDGRNDATMSQRWTPTIKITFSGNHVWAGVRQLVEAGIIDGEKMPGWMTGEDGVTTGLVRHGRIRGHKGSGM